MKRGRGDDGSSLVASADDLEGVGLGSRPRVDDNFGRVRVAGSTRGRLDRRLTIPGFGAGPLERVASLFAPASESSDSVSVVARRGYAFLVAFSTNGPVSFGVATDGPLVMVGRRRYRARLTVVNDRPFFN